ncbi:MAG: protein phosphatase 2C domain-containing protein [Candidatus Methanomethylophilaceae archaeon]|nr:protein phosphatase 2C domain-containing protein [Candidatus Methanomethylophilaceae archaeon]
MSDFHGISGSRRGRSHIDSGTVCQDSTARYESEELAIAAVSDGHGGSKHFRSDVGSKAAAECAVTIIREFVESEGFEESFRSNQDVLLDNVCRTVLASWYSRIEDYDRTYPLTDEERKLIEEKGIVEPADDTYHHIRYGATLMASAISDRFAFCIQIGDGEIACIGEDGKDFSPMPEDPDCKDNVTTSLCQASPLDSFRYWCSADSVPIAIAMSSDGVTNTFGSIDSYVRFCRTASCFALDGGDQWGRLMDRLIARSDASVMDDVSMAVVCRECPELRRMKDEVDAKYRVLDKRVSVSVEKVKEVRSFGSSRKSFVSGPLEFRLYHPSAVLASYKGKDETVHIPERLELDGETYEVCGISSKCFSKSSMRHVVIPATVRTIESKAFYKCQRLEDVTFKGSPELDLLSFFSCNRLSIVYYSGKAPEHLGKNVALVRKGRGRARKDIPSSPSGSTGPSARLEYGRRGSSALWRWPASRDASPLSCWIPARRVRTQSSAPFRRPFCRHPTRSSPDPSLQAPSREGRSPNAKPRLRPMRSTSLSSR